MEKIELNLKNPIFVYYICTLNTPRSVLEKQAEEIQKAFSIYSNITVWIVPTEGDSRIELIYGDKSSINSKEFLVKVKQMVELDEYDKLKSYIRDIKLDILNED